MRIFVIVSILALAAAAASWWWQTADNHPATPTETPVAAPAAESRQDIGGGTPGEADDAQAAEPDAPPFGLSREEAQRRKRLLELEEAAQARFSETAELDGLRAEDVQPGVRALFDSVTLQPAYDVENGTEGFVNGLRIMELTDNNPLAKAGFHAGDRLTRFDGQPLVDPAQIAYTMTSLGESFEVCADRNGSDFCRVVDASGG